jgi:Uma2 family endonuclease
MAEGRVLTYQDLLAFPDDGLRRELINGELIVSAAPYLRHQRILGRLHLALGNHVAAHGGGVVYLAPSDVILSDINVVEPDLVFIADSQLDIQTEANIQGVPSLLIEVLSNARVDRVRKRDLYASFGVSEYWIADPESDRVEVYLYDGAGYAKPVILEAGDEITYEGLPGLRIAVADLFAP